MQATIVQEGCSAGAIGRIVQLHGSYYHQQWNFGPYFEAKVATELAEFLGRYEPSRDGFWTARSEASIEGSIVIDGLHGRDQGAHLRWFMVSEALRGKGVGNRLIGTAVDFCRGRGYAKIYLWTFRGLEAARHLYEKTGFRLTEEHPGRRWGTEVVEQRYELRME